MGWEGGGKEGGDSQGVRRDFQSTTVGGRREALHGWLHPAKEKITKEKVQDCTENKEKGRTSGRDSCFRWLTARRKKGGGGKSGWGKEGVRALVRTDLQVPQQPS